MKLEIPPKWTVRPASEFYGQFVIEELVPETEPDPFGDDGMAEAISEREQAVANLIAAVPEMKKALEAIDQGFQDGSIKFTKRRQSDGEPYHPANTLLNAALRKIGEKR